MYITKATGMGDSRKRCSLDVLAIPVAVLPLRKSLLMCPNVPSRSRPATSLFRTRLRSHGGVGRGYFDSMNEMPMPAGLFTYRLSILFARAENVASLSACILYFPSSYPFSQCQHPEPSHSIHKISGGKPSICSACSDALHLPNSLTDSEICLSSAPLECIV